LIGLIVVDVTPCFRQTAEKRVQWVTIHRVCGELSVSRSLGDPDFKGFTDDGEPQELFFDFPDDHSRNFVADLLISDPEFRHAEIMEEVS